MYHVFTGKHKFETAIFKFWGFFSYIMGSQDPFYTPTPNHHQASNVKSLNVKLGRDACHSIPFYDISTKNKKYSHLKILGL